MFEIYVSWAEYINIFIAFSFALLFLSFISFILLSKLYYKTYNGFSNNFVKYIFLVSFENLSTNAYF